MTMINNDIAPGATGALTAAKSKATLNQNDFLKLMTTQLTTQDPFNPVDNTQMVAQMAQFSSVAGISEMNASLKTIAAVLNPSRLNDAAGWIGRSMLVSSEVATPLVDGSYAGSVTLPQGADQVSLSFVDQTGAVVHSQSLGARAAGENAFAWNGKNDAGQSVAGGPLKVVVTASAGGQPVTGQVATWTSIGGIQSPGSGGATQLVTGLGLLSPEAAIRLS